MEGEGIDRILDDIEGSAAMEGWLDDEAMAREVRTAEFARASLADRLSASSSLRLCVRELGILDGVVRDVGPDALILESTREYVVPLHAVLWAEGAAERHATATQGTSLAAMLRQWLDCEAVVHTLDGAALPGRISRVGTDHLDIDRRVVAFGALAAVSRPATDRD